MKPTWKRASATLLDRRNAREGTISIFVDYDLLRWTFGLRGEHDTSWYDFVIEFGPVSLSATYWRKWHR